MVQKLEIAGERYTVDENLRKYITKKLGRLDRYLSKHARESAHLEVRLKEHRADGKKQCIASITLYLPHDTINIKESTLNMYAAIDIIQAKLKQQIQRYKERHTTGKLHRRLFSRSRGQMPAYPQPHHPT
jgi:putative sigma-54 modulation protein